MLLFIKTTASKYMHYCYHKEQNHWRQSRTEECVFDPLLVPECSPVLPQQSNA